LRSNQFLANIFNFQIKQLKLQVRFSGKRCHVTPASTAMFWHF